MRRRSGLSERGCTPIERNTRKGIYSYEGRTSDGIGERWSRERGDEERNATFDEVARTSGRRDKAGARNESQARAAIVVDRNIARGEAGWVPLHEQDRVKRIQGLASREAAIQAIRAHGGDRAHWLEMIFSKYHIDPTSVRSNEHRKLVKFLKRYGAIG